MDNLLITIEWRDNDTRDQSAVDGQGPERVELEQCDEVVRAEGEDKIKLLFSRLLWQ